MQFSREGEVKSVNPRPSTASKVGRQTKLASLKPLQRWHLMPSDMSHTGNVIGS